METLTQNQALAAGAIAGGMLAAYLVGALIMYVLLVIAFWKIFTKAGEAGWKSIIPIYNVYVLLKIAGMKNWFWISLIASFVVGFITGLAGNNATLISICSIVIVIFDIVLDIMLSIKMAKSFGKGAGFALGLIFLPNIFTLILGFGKSEYVGTAK